MSSTCHSSPSIKQKSASALHSQRRNSYSGGGGSKVNYHEPSSPVPRHGRSHLLSSTYHPKHSLLTRSGGGGIGGSGHRVGGGRSGLTTTTTTESVGTSASKQSVVGQGGSRSHRQPSKNDTSDLIVTSARIVSSISPSNNSNLFIEKTQLHQKCISSHHVFLPPYFLQY